MPPLPGVKVCVVYCVLARRGCVRLARKRGRAARLPGVSVWHEKRKVLAAVLHEERFGLSLIVGGRTCAFPGEQVEGFRFSLPCHRGRRRGFSAPDAVRRFEGDA